MSAITTYGYGDEATWPFCVGHPNDPRTEVDDDNSIDEPRDEENDLDRRRREADDIADWQNSCAADQAAEDHFAKSGSAS